MEDNDNTPATHRLWYQKRRYLAAVAVVVLVAGYAMGSAAKTSNTATVNVDTAKPGVVRVDSTKTGAVSERTVTVTKTPASCLTALDAADSVAGITAGIMRLAQDGIKAAFARDASGMEAVTALLKAENVKLQKLVAPYNADKALCRAGK